MAKLIELQEAAKILGITPEELTEMRSRNEIYGYRDGSTWKFKTDEIERVKATLGPPALPDDDAEASLKLEPEDNLGSSSPPEEPREKGKGNEKEKGSGDVERARQDTSAGAADEDDVDVIDADAEEDDSDSILVSEEELGKSDENTASTIIGEPDDLVPQEGVAKGEAAGKSDALAGESDLELTLESSDAASPSDAAASDVLADADKAPTASDTANLDKPRGVSDDDLKLAADSGSVDLGLDDAAEGGSRIEVSDDAQASSSGFGSAIDLGLDDDELVLGSGSGSDVTSGAGDSGINLSNPSDSGLSLEEPLELSAGGSGVESLELGEDAESGEQTGEENADDFMLEPVAEPVDEESDSGSQVIALDSGELDESGEAGLLDDEALDENAFEPVDELDQTQGGLDDDGGFEDAGVVAAGTGAGLATTGAGAEEAGYTAWNVLSLFFIVGLLSLAGIMMVDLVRFIWSWNKPFQINSTLMDAILSMMP